VRAVRPDQLQALLDTLPDGQAAYLQASEFDASPHQLILLPDGGGTGHGGGIGHGGGTDHGGGTGHASGTGTAVLGLGDDRSPYAFGDLATRLPAGAAWRLEPGDYDRESAVLGFCLGGYAFRRFRPPKREPALLETTEADRAALSLAEAIWMTRDLVNTPANLLGPAELADAAIALAQQYRAISFRHTGAALEDGYPAITAVGRGSARPPVVAGFHWQGSAAGPHSPLVSLCGKGVVFDTGGYDLKPSAGMLRMKKDMAGAALVLGLARVLMAADLPIRLAVRIGCVENSVSGQAMRPSDVIATRRGLSVEIGNTDAEGRLVLADLLAEASDEGPALLIDCATLTGAARVALGPDLPALFCNDEDFAIRLVAAGQRTHDPLWRLPLWDGYAGWLDSTIADINNVSSKPMAGAVTAALFLRRFVAGGVRWAHLDLYGWNDSARPGRPEGGEATALRALAAAIADDIAVMPPVQNRLVT
jgi:leucyl aminopeptidase